MICLPDLPTTLNTLNDTEQYRRNNKQNSNPKPLHPLSIIKPPLLECARLGLVEELLDNNKSVMPVFESGNLSIVKFKLAVSDSGRIKTEFCMLLLEPLLAVLIMCR
jgi:hypothetical protein